MLYPLSFTPTTRIICINCTKLTYQHRLTLTLEKEQSHTNDIKAFIETQLKFDEDIEPAELTRLRDRVLNKSSGIFLWVNLAVLQLNEVFDRSGQMNAVWDRLEEIPRAAKEAQAPNRERALYGLFQDVIQKDNRNIPELVRLAQIVFCAKRPLNPKELYVVLVQSYGHPFGSLGVSDQALTKKVREASKGLAEVTESEEPTVQFIHETVREFISDGGLKVLTEQPVHTEGYEIMKLSCLHQIQAPIASHIEILTEYRTRGNLRGHGQSKETKKSEHQEFVRQAQEKFPFLEYATRNVFFHADEAESKDISQSNFLEGFPLVEWISTYNLLQRFSTRRFQGLETPMLYVLAHQGCNNLIKNPSASRENYALSTKGEEFPSALMCALYSGDQDTPWTLAGLDTGYGPKKAIAPSKTYSSVENGLLGILTRAGDSHLLRKVLQDGHCADIDIQSSEYIFARASSAEVADILAEYAVRRGSLARVSSYPQVVETGAPHHISLPFIRQAIEQNPDLLEAKIWGGKSMLDYAAEKNFQSLASLYLEKSEDCQSSADQYLRSAVSAANLAMAKHASYHCGANLGSQDESGRTAMHIASEELKNFPYSDFRLEILEFVFTEGVAYIGITDNSGQTSKLALWSAVPHYFSAWLHGTREKWGYLIRTLLSINADFSDLMPCSWCTSKPPHEVPFPTVLILSRCDEGILKDFAARGQWDCWDCRDTLGRTALSWCFNRGHGIRTLEDIWYSTYKIANKGKLLLQQSSVDVNSRDNAGCTVLEHFIRHPWYSNERDLDAFVREFFRSRQLDPNLQTSTGKTPLELIISLYDTWPVEFGDIEERNFCGYDPEIKKNIWSKGQIRQQCFSEHLLKAAELLLGTGKVDLDKKIRCVSCKQTPPALRSMIEASLESQFPGWSQEA